MTPSFRILNLLLLLILTGCSKQDLGISDATNPSKAQKILNVSYGNKSRQVADIYLPANRSAATTACMILVHGGSWIGGDKADVAAFIPMIQKALPEVAIINMNYRLADGTPANSHPTQMADMDSLFLFLNSKSALWHFSASYGLVGISAGAHLSLLYSYAFDAKKRVKLVASVVGPTNLSDDFYTNNLLFQSILTSFLGQPYATNPMLHVQASPVFSITSSAPPTYMAYGGADPLVPVSNPTLLEQKLKQAAVPYKYDFYVNESHEFSNSATNATVTSLGLFWRQHLQ